ncbi:MAG: WYL domain-containing protein [Anaerolineales bacterium]|nr:WYL domain-containing protein [Anaerolineales bacterium]
MIKKKGRGSAESVWHVARRCLVIINRLQAGPITKEELLTAVYQPENLTIDRNNLNRRFENDKNRLKVNLNVPIYYDKGVKGYVINDRERERPLLNLANTHIETLAYLSDTFQADAPHASEVHQLIDQLVDWLPPERQKQFKRVSGQLPTADLRLRDNEDISTDVWENVQEAWQAKQEIIFDYRSSQHDDGILRQHRIQPWDLYFSDRGHWHLRGYCLFNDGPNGPWHPNDYINYRLSRIVTGSVQILPRKMPGVRPNGRLREVSFELAPTIARFGVSRRKELINSPKILELDDGWVRVEGQTHDVFDLARNLLYYGKNCRVLGGKELLRETRQLVADLTEVYQ